jgi:uncharacterized membrane protein
MVGCNGDPIDIDDDDDGEITETECGEDVPLVTWETFGEGFVTTYCQGCHASTAVDRRGAPDHIMFDTEEQTAELAEDILEATLTTATMPPAGGPTPDEIERLEIWLTCFAE